VPMSDVASALPPGTQRVTADERAAVMDARRLAVGRRFVR
jgi:hypothetical protein